MCCANVDHERWKWNEKVTRMLNQTTKQRLMELVAKTDIDQGELLL